MLEVVSVYLARLNNIVRLYVVGELLNVKGDALSRENFLCYCENLCVRRGGGGYGNSLALKRVIIYA